MKTRITIVPEPSKGENQGRVTVEVWEAGLMSYNVFEGDLIELTKDLNGVIEQEASDLAAKAAQKYAS